jgi:hypothetical protein
MLASCGFQMSRSDDMEHSYPSSSIKNSSTSMGILGEQSNEEGDWICGDVKAYYWVASLLDWVRVRWRAFVVVGKKSVRSVIMVWILETNGHS